MKQELLNRINDLKSFVENEMEDQPDKEDQPSSVKKIGIVVGHARNKGGAVSAGGMFEWIYNVDVARLADLLAGDPGFKPILIEVIHGNRGYSDAMEWVAYSLKEQRADIALELHFNAFDGGEARGSEVLCWRQSIEGRHLAQSMLNHIGYLSRGIKPIGPGGRGAKFLQSTHCPAVILEPFFGDNQQDWDRWEGRQEELAGCYFDGIAAFFQGGER